MKKKSTTITAEEFDRKFDDGEDITPYLDMSSAKMRLHIDLPTVRVNVDFPDWVVKALDSEAGRRGIARQALIKTWLIDKLDGLDYSKQQTKARRIR